MLAFPNGALAEISTGNVMVAAESSIEIFGSEGSAALAGVDLARASSSARLISSSSAMVKSAGRGMGRRPCRTSGRGISTSRDRCISDCIHGGAAPVVSPKTGENPRHRGGRVPRCAHGQSQLLDSGKTQQEGRQTLSTPYDGLRPYVGDLNHCAVGYGHGSIEDAFRNAHRSSISCA